LGGIEYWVWGEIDSGHIINSGESWSMKKILLEIYTLYSVQYMIYSTASIKQKFIETKVAHL